MAIYKFSRQTKACGTCDFWMGLKKLDSIWSIQFVIISGAGAEEMGQCANRKSGVWNQNRKANQICPKWELWARLKTF